MSKNKASSNFSSKDMYKYYENKGRKIKEFADNFKIEQAEANLNMSKLFLMKIISQKKEVDKVYGDLKKHVKEINDKISPIESERGKYEKEKFEIKSFANKIKKLEVQSEKILKVRGDLIKREAELIKEMKVLAKGAKKKFNLVEINKIERLIKFESTKESSLMNAKRLLSKEIGLNFSDSSLLESLDEKAHRKISKLNERLEGLYCAKRDVLKKLHLAEITEERANKKLQRAEAKIKKLEEQYKKLLEKKK